MKPKSRAEQLLIDKFIEDQVDRIIEAKHDIDAQVDWEVADYMKHDNGE